MKIRTAGFVTRDGILNELPPAATLKNIFERVHAEVFRLRPWNGATPRTLRFKSGAARPPTR